MGMKKEIQNIVYEIVDNPKLSKKQKIHSLIVRLDPYLDFLSKMREDYMLSEDDYRSGWDTYGYDDINQIYERLEYISDRLFAAFRINWLIGLIDDSDYMHAKKWLENDYKKTLELED